MTMSYEPQIAQMNEKLPRELSPDLMLTQHLRDEDPKSREMRLLFKIEPP